MLPKHNSIPLGYTRDHDNFHVQREGYHMHRLLYIILGNWGQGQDEFVKSTAKSYSAISLNIFFPNAFPEWLVAKINDLFLLLFFQCIPSEGDVIERSECQLRNNSQQVSEMKEERRKSPCNVLFRYLALNTYGWRVASVHRNIKYL